jgi:hypothetical protein
MSADGRTARDVLLGLTKTCRKLGVSFWRYLGDRLRAVPFRRCRISSVSATRTVGPLTAIRSPAAGGACACAAWIRRSAVKAGIARRSRSSGVAPQGGTVTVVPHHRDRYGRVVGDVYCRGQNIGRSMDADGYSKRVGLGAEQRRRSCGSAQQNASEEF